MLLLAAPSTLLDCPADRLPRQQCLTLQKIDRKITSSSTSTCDGIIEAVSFVRVTEATSVDWAQQDT